MDNEEEIEMLNWVSELTCSEYIREAILGIELQRGVKGKTEELRRLARDSTPEHFDVLKQVLKYAYDDQIRFGIGANRMEVMLTESPDPRDINDWVFTALDRVIMETSSTKKEALLNDITCQLNKADSDLLRAIVDKDLRCGINKSTINKALPGLLSEFSVMLAKPFTDRQAVFPAIVEPKLDGMRVIAIVRPEHRDCTFYSRTGKVVPSLTNYCDEVIAFAMQFTENGAVAFDGEVTSGSFLESISEIRSGSEKVTDGTFHVFDVLVNEVAISPIAMTDVELAGQGTQSQRRARLTAGWQAFKKVYEPKFIKPTATYVASDAVEVATLYSKHRDAGFEGVIVKDPNAPYVKKRAASWLKLKAEESLDLPIIGAFEGEGQFVGQLGGLIVDHNGVEVRVGSGFSATQRADYWQQLQRDAELQEAGRGDERVLLGNLAEVQFQEIMPSGSLRHPVFKRLRTDKALGVGSF